MHEIEGGFTQGQAVEGGPQVNDVALFGAGGVEALEDVVAQMDAEALTAAIAAVQRAGATALQSAPLQAGGQAELIEDACQGQLAGGRPGPAIRPKV